MVKPLEKYPVLIIGSTGCAYTTQSHGRKQGTNLPERITV